MSFCTPAPSLLFERLIHPAPDGPLARIALSADGRSLYFLRNVTEGDIWVGTFR